MKIKYLGTGASEGFPATFCNCEFCREARRIKGKNIRTRSQTIINDDLLIDLPADTYSHFLANDIEGDKIKYLFITHSHIDHFYREELKMRTVPYAHNMQTEKLKMYYESGVGKKIDNDEYLQNMINQLELNEIKPFDVIDAGDYTVTALPARHHFKTGAVIYIISGDKTVLYAHDTGYLYEEVFDYIKENQITFDLVSLDCTNIDIATTDESSHMGLEHNRRVIKRLEEMGAVGENTKKVINHFSHNGNPLHHVLEDKVKNDGFIVAYDGLEIEI